MADHRIATLADLDDDAVEAFRRRGFLAVDRLIGDDDLAVVRAAYDDVIAGRLAAPGDRLLGGIIRQVKGPSSASGVFADNAAIDAGLQVAAAVFGHDRFEPVYEMLIDKPPHTPHETPWHQDIGYFGKPVVRAGAPGAIEDIQIWLALDDVDVDNGCMQFIPTAYGTPALAHVVAAGDPDDEGRLVAIDPTVAVDQERAVACPLPAGGATMHFVSTPHYTGPNRTADRPRRAYIFNIGPAGLAAAAAMAMKATWGDKASPL